MPTQDIKIIRSKRSSISMSVAKDATIVVRAPFFMPQIFISQFIRAHQDWIDKQISKINTASLKNKIYTTGETFLFLGIPVILEIGNYKEISVAEGKLFFPNFLQFRIEKELTSWYIKQAKKLITQQVERYAKEMRTSYTGLTFSDTTSQWGSCSPENKLQFSWRLIMTPILTLNYVVIHELAHTKQKNHSDKFWKVVEQYIPSYKIQRRWLKNHGNTLII